MPANTNPIYVLTPRASYAVMTAANIAANTKSDGTGNLTSSPDMILLFTPGSFGSYVNRIRVKAQASAASTNTAATVLRLYLSSINTGATTNADTILIDELYIPITAADAPAATTLPYEFMVNTALPSNRYLLASTHVAIAASTSFGFSVIGGDY